MRSGNLPRRSFGTVVRWAAMRLLSDHLIELRIVPEDAVLIEWNAPVRLEVCRNPGPFGDTVTQRPSPRAFGRGAVQRARKRIAEPFDDLEQGQIRVGALAAHEPAPRIRVGFEHALEVGQELRQPLAREVPAPA